MKEGRNIKLEVESAAAPVEAASAPVVPPPMLRVYFGSQTGTATSMARALVKAAVTQHRMRAEVVDLGKFSQQRERGESSEEAVTNRINNAKRQLLEPGVAVFLTATYGEGDPSDNAVDFVKWISSGEHPTDLLSELRFTVFGLGNKTYEYYNRTGKVVNARLESLGAQRVYAYGEGDDDKDMEFDFQLWQEDGLWAALKAAMNSIGADKSSSMNQDIRAFSGEAGRGAQALPTERTASSQGIGDVGRGELSPPTPHLDWRIVPVPPPIAYQTDKKRSGNTTPSNDAFEVAMSEDSLKESGSTASPGSLHFFSSMPLRVLENRELRPNPSPATSTRLIELELLPFSGSSKVLEENLPCTYGTSDTCYVCPENSPVLVKAIASRLGYDLSSWFTLEPWEPTTSLSSLGGTLFPTPCSVRAALTCFLDLGAHPKRLRAALPALAPYASLHSGERKRLEFLGSSQGKKDWEIMVLSEGKGKEGVWGLAELLQEFPSLRPPLEALCQIMPLLQPRAYTIASSPLSQPNFFSLAVSLLPAGCASSFLSRTIPLQSTVRVSIKPSPFKLPINLESPLLLVGSGTGLAPMRGFLQERLAMVRSGKGGGGSAGPAVLFFGCRRSEEDFIFKDELQNALMDGSLTKLFTAFSRENVARSGATQGVCGGGLASKFYVQHLIEEKGREVWEILQQQDSHVYVCGATAMGADVMLAIQKVVEKHGGVNGHDFVKSMQLKHQYIQELWSSS